MNPRIELVRGNIVVQDVDAIVNAANEGLWAGGGVCGAIHDVAGPELQVECRAIGRCPTGSARITKGYRLKARHVIHAVAPRYAGSASDAGKLASAYRESLRLAGQHGLRSIAFPSLGTGIYGYPLREAAPIALQTIEESLETVAKDLVFVRMMLWDEPTFEAFTSASKTL